MVKETLSVYDKNMKIECGAFRSGENIPPEYTCDGDNVCPPLSFVGAPQGTESFALIVDDPDSPSGVWNHWTIWNISSDTREIAEGKVPSGAREGTTTFGDIGYGGPCPGSGKHRYFFKLYALDATANLVRGAAKKELMEAMKPHILEVAELFGYYERKKQGV